MKAFLGLFLLLALMTCHSNATYCLCKDGVGDKQLQADLDYACGALADCSAIQPNGACYQPNTLKSHCDYAVNSYFQNAAQAAGSCHFSGSAATSEKPPPNVVAGCVYPSSPSDAKAPPTGGSGGGRGGFPGTTPSGTPVGNTPYGGGTPVGNTPYGGGTPVGNTPYGGGTPVGNTPYGGGTPFGNTPYGGGTPGGGMVFGKDDPDDDDDEGGAASLHVSSALAAIGFSALVFLWSH
ncbi:PREDICTED: PLASMODESMATA CALLOSE-BINDING PROTEIN 1-like [Tarenaya hassleriana]|uniref:PLASMODESMATA CALLOSE-BINDING PROTEIN 1-like n=1 Tax=Tarenaya hassleriana TaxID=28532 RepID=UPI00053C9B74|nr:PREDICTED: PLASMODESMATA CALLOSE-BINDING PROTEIN 1-like [Tarenaya hassleriana]